jgi:UDP-N-acetylglucosamine 2-epimerase (non-hydrolysing)
VRVICIAGGGSSDLTVKPVMDALASRGAEVIGVHAGQRHDPPVGGASDGELGLRPDHYLGAGPGSHAARTAAVLTAFEPLAERLRPDAVLVAGDADSTLACALVAAKSGALLGHVGAGLRGEDWSGPAEVNRMVTDRVSDYLFAASPDAVASLRAEGCANDRIRLVGNVMVDGLLASRDQALRGGTLARLGLTPGGYGLVALSVAGAAGDRSAIGPLLPALDRVARMCPLVWPAHPGLAARLSGGSRPGRLQVVRPAGYLDFVALQASALLVLTDSGLVQETTTALGVPCLTVRDSTERPVTLSHGTNQLVGSDPERIVRAARSAIETPPPPSRPALWDGHAGERVAAEIVSGGTVADRRRPVVVPRPRQVPAEDGTDVGSRSLC